MKKRLILIIITYSFISAQGVFAQDLYIGFSVNYMFGFSKSTSFGKFVDSYNKVFEADLTHKLNNIGSVYGYSFSFEGAISMFYGGLNIMHLNGKSYATFTNGLKRYFSLENSAWIIPIGFGNFVNNGGYFFGALGIGMSNMVMSSYARYADGTISMGNERVLNGAYKSSAILLAPEIQFGKSFGRVAAGLNIAYHFNTFSLGNSDYFNLDRDRMSSIPEDYENYLKNPNFGIVFDEVKFNFNGLIAGFNLKYNLAGN